MIGRRWMLPLSWAALILALTSVPGSAVPDVGMASADKLVHLLLYAVLGALALFAVWDPERPIRSALIAVVGVAAFGGADELHQIFIPGRSADLLDWLADAVGGVSGAVVAATTGWGREQAT